MFWLDLWTWFGNGSSVESYVFWIRIADWVG